MKMPHAQDKAVSVMRMMIKESVSIPVCKVLINVQYVLLTAKFLHELMYFCIQMSGYLTGVFT